MRKKLLALLLCATAAFAMTACGGDKTGSVDGTEVEENLLPIPELTKNEINYADCVTLGDYETLAIELSDNYEVTDALVEDYLAQTFAYYGPFYAVDETKTVVAEGDVVCVDYVGKLDGVAFDNGSATNQNIEVDLDNTSYIPGFVDGLVGAEVGTEIDCPVTFPEDYHATDLAGKDAVFTFTVHSIQKEITVEEMDDAFVKEYFGADSVEALKTEMYESLVNEANYYKSQEISTAIQEHLLGCCTVEIPADYFADLQLAFRNSFINQNCDGDESQLEAFLSENYGYTVEEAEEMWAEGLREEAQFEFILNAIAEEKGYTLDETAYQEYVDAYMEYYGYETEEDFFAGYGYGDPVYGEQYVKNINIWNQVMEGIQEQATITGPGLDAE